MKYIKSYILLALMTFSVTGCKIDDLKDDVNDLKDRVTLMEEQVKILNDNVEVMAYVLDPQQKTISSVTENEGQYVITLSDGTVLTLTAGAPGTVQTPSISVDENGYWVVNGISTGVKAKGEDGANGDGIPEFRLENGVWQVRFGSDGAWTPVEGGNLGEGSMGDQIFELATVTGDKFVVVLANEGGTYELPIVAQLTCVIDKTGQGADGYFNFQSGESKTFKVKIEGEGEPLAPVYPYAWRAELEKLGAADENGYNYQLVVYAPAQTAASSRVTADNTSEISIRAHKGAFWAVDKIKVQLPKAYDSNYAQFMDGAEMEVNGYAFSKESLGITDEQAVKIVTENTDITESGVYFVNADNVEFTYSLNKENKVDYLVILPYSGDKHATLTVKNQIYLNKIFICQNVDMKYTASSSYPLRIQPGTPANVILNNCKVEGLKAGSGFAMPNAADNGSLERFSVVSCDFNIGDTNGQALNLVNNMDCGTFEFENNIVYRSVPKTEGMALNFKLLNAQSRTLNSLVFNNNTIVGLESTTTAMIYANQINEIDIRNNIFWNTEMDANSMFIRYRINMPDESKAKGENNIGYTGTGGKTFKVCFTDSGAGITCPSGIPNGAADFQKSDIFDVNDANSFNTATGVFVPAASYQSYGAQR